MEEEWRPIEGHPGYWVSDQGNVIGVRGRLLKPFLRSGYQAVRLRRSHLQYVHKLVLETFIGPAEPGQECLHENGQREDNRLVNLRWGTRSENILDAVRHGTWKQHGKRRL